MSGRPDIAGRREVSSCPDIRVGTETGGVVCLRPIEDIADGLQSSAKCSGWSCKAWFLSDFFKNRYPVVMIAETELAMVQRHVRQGQERVSRQVAIIAQMVLQKQSTDLAEELLLSFKWIQQAHEDHLDRLTYG